MTLGVDITGRGDPLVLIHGLATTRSIWRHAAPRLAATRQVVTLDVPGFGAARPVGRGFDLQDVAARVADDLRAVGAREPFDLVGHSMGGAVALTLAAREPHACAASYSSRPPGCDRSRCSRPPRSASPPSCTSRCGGGQRRWRGGRGGGGC